MERILEKLEGIEAQIRKQSEAISRLAHQIEVVVQQHRDFESSRDKAALERDRLKTA